MEKYKKLIFSQICAVAAIGAAVLAWLRYEQVGSFSEPVALSFVLFAIVLFVMEIRLITDWLRAQKRSR